jgi:hypothetical protein
MQVDEFLLDLHAGRPLTQSDYTKSCINPLNAELNPFCHLLALLEAHHILHVSRVRVNTIVLLRMSTELLET